ncbi:hypothetical protein [Bacillus sp. FJAT-22090]|uniref:hypothetical protein n=1 Tax=Bacillus sp. FJAT-22090 TaxID=1581038 RepID=UPI001643104B|nr:hypothetical protein [Bacillus sp. FJAT-22090]
MPEWIKGQGFYYVQPSGPIDHEANRKQMEQVERNLEEAEIRLGIRKELSA